MENENLVQENNFDSEVKQPVEEKHKSKKGLIIVIMILAFMVLVIGVLILSYRFYLSTKYGEGGSYVPVSNPEVIIQSADTTGWSTYRNEAIGIEIKHPLNEKPYEFLYDNGGIDVRFKQNINDEIGVYNFSISKEDNQFVNKEYYDTLLNDYNGGGLIKNKRKIAGYDADYYYDLSDYSTFDVYIFQKNGFNYIFTVATSVPIINDEYERAGTINGDRAIFEAMVDSFNIFEPTEVITEQDINNQVLEKLFIGDDFFSQNNLKYSIAVIEGTINQDPKFCNKITAKQYLKIGDDTENSWRTMEELRELCVLSVNQNIDTSSNENQIENNTDTSSISSATLKATSEEPAWATTLVDIDKPFVGVMVEYEFLSEGGDGTLSIHFEGNIVWTFLEKIYGNRGKQSETIGLGDLYPPGKYSFAVRLDAETKSEARVSTVEFFNVEQNQ